MSASSMFQDNLRLLKTIHQWTSEPVVEPIKNGIHVGFKLLLQDEQTKQKSMIKKHICLSKVLFLLPVVLFDVPKPNVDWLEDKIIFTQKNVNVYYLKQNKKCLIEYFLFN